MLFLIKISKKNRKYNNGCCWDGVMVFLGNSLLLPFFLSSMVALVLERYFSVFLLRRSNFSIIFHFVFIFSVYLPLLAQYVLSIGDFPFFFVDCCISYQKYFFMFFMKKRFKYTLLAINFLSTCHLWLKLDCFLIDLMQLF